MTCSIQRRLWSRCAFLLVLLGLASVPATAETAVLQFKGVGEAVALADVPGSDLVNVDPAALCYKVPLFDPETRMHIGNGYDCLWEIVAPTFNRISVTDTAFFQVRGGLIISEGRVEIREGSSVAGSSSGVGQGKTHITGGLPDDNNILVGRGQFRGIEGYVRVSGAVDMSAFPSTIVFDCLFVLQYELPD